ncbi:MAG: hypothetical protein ACOCG5_07410 [Candidatus Alkaliphilus sp. MAG34]|jgi:hypothetical protein
MMEKIEEIKNKLWMIQEEYSEFNDNTYDIKILILREQVSVLEDILSDELDELLIDWEITLEKDKKEYWENKL